MVSNSSFIQFLSSSKTYLSPPSLLRGYTNVLQNPVDPLLPHPLCKKIPGYMKFNTLPESTSSANAPRTQRYSLLHAGLQLIPLSLSALTPSPRHFTSLSHYLCPLLSLSLFVCGQFQFRTYLGANKIYVICIFGNPSTQIRRGRSISWHICRTVRSSEV